MNTVVMSCLKASEGGVPQSDAIRLLRDEGVDARSGYSPYVGHYGIEVPARQERRAARLLWGSVRHRKAVYKRRASR